MTIKTNNDLKVGMVLETKNGDRYVVVADDNGAKDVISLINGNSNGIEVGVGKLSVCGGVKGGRDVVAIFEFSGQPTRNRLSEALKFLTRKQFTEELTLIWELVDPYKIKLEKEIADAEETIRRAQEELNFLNK